MKAELLDSNLETRRLLHPLRAEGWKIAVYQNPNLYASTAYDTIMAFSSPNASCSPNVQAAYPKEWYAIKIKSDNKLAQWDPADLAGVLYTISINQWGSKDAVQFPRRPIITVDDVVRDLREQIHELGAGSMVYNLRYRSQYLNDGAGGLANNLRNFIEKGQVF